MSWKWLQRPRWLLAVTAGVFLLTWLFWPVKTYRGLFPFFIAVSRAESRDFLGTVSPRFLPDQWMAEDEFEKLRAGLVEIVPGIGDEAMWATGVFLFRTANINWRIDPSPEIKGFKSGEPGWEKEIEKLARRTAEELGEGKLEHSNPVRVPRLVLWVRNRYAGWQARVEAWIESP